MLLHDALVEDGGSREDAAVQRVRLLEGWYVDGDIRRIVALLVHVSHGGMVMVAATASRIVHVLLLLLLLLLGGIRRVHGLLVRHRRGRWGWMKEVGRLMVGMNEMMVDHGHRHGYRHLLLMWLQRGRRRRRRVLLVFISNVVLLVVLVVVVDGQDLDHFYELYDTRVVFLQNTDEYTRYRDI